MQNIPTIIRTHIKNHKRLELLERTIVSWHDKQLYDLGELYIIDDTSPLQDELLDLLRNFQIKYKRSNNTPDTKNGLYESLKIDDGWNEIRKDSSVLCTVDDIVFGNGFKERIIKFLEEEESQLENFGMMGLFACYGPEFRINNRYKDLHLFNFPLDKFYGANCHIYSKQLSKLLLENWEGVLNKTEPYPFCCDDLWVRDICKKEGLNIYNSIVDYAQHTGMNVRSFGDKEIDEGSEYQSSCFIGE